jgi:hypothetical protein
MSALARLPLASTDAAEDMTIPKVLRMVPVATVFCNATLGDAVDLLQEIDWNQGVDELNEIGLLTVSLDADFTLLDTGIRDDDFIRARATATLRRLSAKFRRDDAFGLVRCGSIDPAALACPDFVDFLSI